MTKTSLFRLLVETGGKENHSLLLTLTHRDINLPCRAKQSIGSGETKDPAHSVVNCLLI